MIVPEGLHLQVGRGYKLISFSIISFIIKERGKTTLGSIELHTGLGKAELSWAVDILLFLQKQGIVAIKGNRVTASVAKLAQLKEQEKINLPDNFGKPWSEDDTNILCEMSLDKKHPHKIAIKLKRTENSILMQQTFLRKTGRVMPWITRNPAIKVVVEKFVSPNPDI